MCNWEYNPTNSNKSPFIDNNFGHYYNSTQ